jgi:polysaccharide biosynthesis transport protein
MELIYYFRLLRRWWWLVLVAAFIGGIVAFIQTISQPLQYRTQTTISIGNVIESPNPDSGDIRAGQDLVQTYQLLVRTYDVRQGVVDVLQLPFSADELNKIMSIKSFLGTSLLEISVTYNDPVLVAEIANEISRQLILGSPTNLTDEQQEQLLLLQEQVRIQTSELASLRTQISQINARLVGQVLDDETTQELVQERNNLIDQVNTASSNLAQFTNTIASFQQRTNSIEIVERARIPSDPVDNNTFSSVTVAVFLGAVLSFGGVVVYDYLNDTLRNADEVSTVLDSPVLGVI